MPENLLYYGDNLDILRRYIDEGTIDLIYLDPPFKSGQDYNVLFAEKNGSQSTAQIKVFEDTWHWGNVAEKAYQEIVMAGGKVSKVMQAFRIFLNENDMMAYLSMMAPRLIELKRVLKPTGSIFLHCDPTASHYLKLLMDAIFDPRNFRNEIVWTYTRPGTKHQKQFPRVHDIIFWYSKDKKWKFNTEDIRIPYSTKTIERGLYSIETSKVTPGIKKRVLHKKGKVPEDYWHIPMIQGNARERLGYPTQKPEALLERIIQVGSDEGDIVLDPFCGCGTAIAVAQRLNRYWIGIDITHLAIALIKHRLKDAFDNDISFRVFGEPVTLPDAEILAKQDKYQFEWWALGLVGARPAPIEQKKGKDRGIDGRIYFFEKPGQKQPKQIILSVKGGKVSVSHIRDLRGVVEREKASIGVYISLNKPTRDMIKESVSAGFYIPEYGLEGKQYPKIQLLTIKELLEGRGIDCPPFLRSGGNVTFKKAPKVKKQKKERTKQKTLHQE